MGTQSWTESVSEGALERTERPGRAEPGIHTTWGKEYLRRCLGCDKKGGGISPGSEAGAQSVEKKICKKKNSDCFARMGREPDLQRDGGGRGGGERENCLTGTIEADRKIVLGKVPVSLI